MFPSENRCDLSGSDNQVDFKAVQIVLYVVLAVPAINVHLLIAGKETLNFNHGSAPLLRFDLFSCPHRIGVVVRRQQDYQGAEIRSFSKACSKNRRFGFGERCGTSSLDASISFTEF